MKAIAIDFAPPSVARAVLRVRRPAWVAGCIGLMLCAGAALSAYGLDTQHDLLDTELRRVRTQLERHAARRVAPRTFTLPEAQMNAVNGAIAQLNLPWPALFDSIEAATPASIALLALEPDAKTHRVKGVAEARTGDDMIAYVEQLKGQPLFEDVLLVRHETNEQDPNKPLRFQFAALWLENVP